MSILIKDMEMPDCCFHCVCSDDGCGITGDTLTIEEMRERPDWCPLEELPECGDAVSRKWLLEGVEEEWIKFDTEEDYNRYIHLVRDIAPSVMPERKKGKWIKTNQSFVFPEKFKNYSCSECGYDVDKIKFNFCPNCGADMRG